MIIKKCFSVLFLFTFLFLGCSSENMKSYKQIKQSHKNLESMYQDVYLYDLENPDFFESKLDLARYYILVGSYNQSWPYLVRAESIAKKSPKQVSKENEAALYGCYATLYLMNNEVETAYSYVEKACAVPKYGIIYGYLAGRILTTLERNEEALKYFDETYKKYPNLITGEEIRSYMYLLGESKNYKKAQELLELYFEKGEFFSGLGLFASGVYEKNNLFVESIFSAFLDYEYQSCFGNADDKRFVQNLNELRNKLVSESKDEESINAVDYMLSLYLGTDVEEPKIDFFPFEYIKLKKTAKNRAWSNKEFNEYMALEKYFKNFPCYYWNLWTMLPKVQAGDLSNWKVILEKIIMLGNSDYYDSSRVILGKLCGLNDSDASKILLPQEVQRLILIYINDSDKRALEYIYSLLNLPDCDYVIQGTQVIKQNIDNKTLSQALYEKSLTASGRLKERINYILS
ncbi:lipopolysaccharide assembly protein LapB [Treponema sp. Marseille-Q3903]|uniref:tetratricopeptide repeat protein n=1 Tax=Treponema sp. Marseille-Q3903 TaxID=2766703 RepID=UPI00165261E2|nr:hypothetical protein [Treponema sp. Marseille-Q3903]MBC6714053.1 hypothetical protein [Treponema sp. Marseille-Q3903]